MKKVAPLRYGVIFKKAFCDVDVFKGFVRDIIGINLEIDHVETEKSFKPTVGDVDIKFDLYAEDKKNRLIVDIQHERHTDHYDRFLYYHCIALIQQIKSGANYRPPLGVYTIVVLTSGDKHKRDVSVIDFDPKDLEGKSLNEIPHKIIYLCPKYLNAKTPVLYREWLQVIDDSLDGAVEESNYHLPEIQKILAYIEEDDISPIEKRNMIEESYFDEVESKGIEKGLIKGIEKGIETGKVEIAQTMLKQGFDIKTIASITHLTEEIISQLV